MNLKGLPKKYACTTNDKTQKVRKSLFMSNFPFQQCLFILKTHGQKFLTERCRDQPLIKHSLQGFYGTRAVKLEEVLDSCYVDSEKQ